MSAAAATPEQLLAELVALFRASSAAADTDTAPPQSFELAATIGLEQLALLLNARLAHATTAPIQSAYADPDEKRAFLPALQAAFWALSASSAAREAPRWRRSFFAGALQALHAQNASNALTGAALAVLLRELHAMRASDLPPAVDELLRGVALCQQLQRARPGDGLVVFYSIELLPQLLLRIAQSPRLDGSDTADAPVSGAAFCDRALTKLLALAWPPRFFLQVLKTFRDFPITSDQERAFCAKIYRETDRALPDEVALDSRDRHDSVELLPTVFYHITLLIGRTLNAFCKRLLMNLLLRKCDVIARGSAVLYADQRAGAMAPSSASGRELKGLLSTMVYHVDLVLKHDESLATVFLAEYELRTKALTAFDVGLLLTVAAQDQYDARVTALLVQRVTESYSGDIAAQSTGAATRSAFLDTIVHPQDGNWSPVTQRMVQFGFALLDHAAGSSKDQLPLYADFAVRIVLGCFQHHESAREKVVDQLVNAIVVQDSGSRAALSLLARLVKRHALELSPPLTARLQECLEYVTHLTPAHARLLFAALSPLLRVRPAVKSYLVLTLRKAMFRKDDASRMIAISGFAFLLCLSSAVFSRSSSLTQLYSQNTTTLLSQGVDTSSGVESELATQEHANAVVAEDLYRQFCGIFKRALQLQTRVRLVLYAELTRVFRECPTLRPSILELVFQHYGKFYDANESLLPPLNIDSCLARSRNAYEEPLGFLLHVLLTCVVEIKRDSADGDGSDLDDMMIGDNDDDDIPATQTAGVQRAFDAVEKNVAVLMERMKRCELTDFEIDKNLSFTPQTAMGQSNQRLAWILLGVWEVCMNWTIESTAAANGTVDEATKTALSHYLDMHKWLRARLVESEEKEKDSAASNGGGAKKRGRPSSKLKLPQPASAPPAGGSDRTSASSGQEDDASFFAANASFSSGLLVSPSSVVSVLAFSLTKLQTDPTSVSRDDENLLLFALEKAALVVAFAQQQRRSSSVSTMVNQKSVLVGESRVLVDRLGAIVFGIFYACNDRAPSAAGSGTKRSPRESASASHNQMETIRIEALKVFSAVVSVWMQKSSDEAADCLGHAFSSVGVQDEDELAGDGDTSKLENCAVVVHRLLDALLARGLTAEAIVLLRVVRSVWYKLPARVVSKCESWMKRVLLRGSFASQKLLEAVIHLFLRPHPDLGLVASFVLQLTKGLLHHCNGSDDSSEVTEFANAPDRLRLERLDDKSILTCAIAVLARCEEAMSELEPRVKEFDAQQRRQTMKLKEDDVLLLQTLEDETGAAVLDIATSTSKIQARYKELCRKLFELCGILMPFAMMDLSKVAVSIRVIRLIGRLYKLLVVMVNCKLRRKDSSLPKYLQRLFERVATGLSPTLLEFISCIHDEGKKAALASASKSRAKQQASASATQSKLIPDVIFQLEQFDVALIKLSKLSKVRCGLLSLCEVLLVVLCEDI